MRIQYGTINIHSRGRADRNHFSKRMAGLDPGFRRDDTDSTIGQQDKPLSLPAGLDFSRSGR